MEKLLLKHYELIKARGLITPETKVHHFMEKLDQEILEVAWMYCDDLFMECSPSNEFNQELVDLVMVVFNYFQHYSVDFREELIKNIKIQETRVKK